MYLSNLKSLLLNAIIIWRYPAWLLPRLVFAPCLPENELRSCNISSIAIASYWLEMLQNPCIILSLLVRQTSAPGFGFVL
jgi:hypothetical protein